MNIVQPAVPPLSPDLIARFRGIVGDKYAVTDAADIAPYVTEERDLFHGRSPLVLRPGSTAEVSASVKLCAAAKIPLVPQGTPMSQALVEMSAKGFGCVGIVRGETELLGIITASTTSWSRFVPR